jgi:hypothetical protein
VAITYENDPALDLAAVAEVFRRSSIRRPVDDLERIGRMIAMPADRMWVLVCALVFGAAYVALFLGSFEVRVYKGYSAAAAKTMLLLRMSCLLLCGLCVICLRTTRGKKGID